MLPARFSALSLGLFKKTDSDAGRMLGQPELQLAPSNRNSTAVFESEGHTQIVLQRSLCAWGNDLETE